MRITLALLALVATACAEDTLVDGDIAGRAMPEPGGVYWGGPFIVLTGDPLDCIDVAWVQRNYTAGVSPTEFDVLALQFAYDQDEVSTGYFSVAGESAVFAKAVLVEGGAFVEHRARGGELQVDVVEAQGVVEGSFSVTFEDGSLSTSYFQAEYCVNLER